MHRRRSSAAVLLLIAAASLAAGDPQANPINVGCSQYNATNRSDFAANLNATLADLNASLAASPLSRFATAQQPRSSDPVFALFQCRDYLSTADCAACLAASVALLRRCAAANGARAILDGCSLRYESAAFFDQTTLPGNTAVCGNRTDNRAGFTAAAEGLMSDLGVVAPRISGFFAAAERDGVYGIAQCAETVSESGCGDCLSVAHGNIQGCPPNSDGRAVDAGCFMRYSDMAFFPANQTIDLAAFLDSGSSSNRGAIIGGVVGGVGGLLILGLVLFLWIRRSRKMRKARGDILGATELRGPVNFRYHDLKSATKNFSEENKLGEGGFGDVYKGVLKNGNTVAVKKLIISQSSRAKEDFQSEVKLISNVHHRNLVRLLGCSSKGSTEMLLVYEYMANSSLDKFLFGEKRSTLNWRQRFDIIVGMARGLAYLHHEFHVCIIHRDIKSSNVLLDDDFQPRIADFGLARLLPGDQTHVSTRFAGTLGYTAPEYAIHGKLSEKVDTYSYGVVVLEIISGRKSNDISLEPLSQYLLEWAWMLYENGTLMDLVDETLDPNEYDVEEVKRVIEIALLCTQSTVAARPIMSDVVVMLLSKGVGPMAQPTRPTFIDAASRVRGESGDTSGSAPASASTGSPFVSSATVSVSHISAR